MKESPRAGVDVWELQKVQANSHLNMDYPSIRVVFLKILFNNLVGIRGVIKSYMYRELNGEENAGRK